MVNKKAGIIAVSLLTAALLAVGGTIAYFTARAEVKNVVTMGNVKISLTEPLFEGEGPDNSIGLIVPGDTITKDPTITNTGKNDCYVRARIKVKAVPLSQNSKSISDEELEELVAQIYSEELFEGTVTENVGDKKSQALSSPLFNVNIKNWIYNVVDGYFYYQQPLAANTKAVLFDKVFIPKTWGNKYADVSFKIEIVAEAVQKDNFTPVTLLGNIVGWHNIPIEG